MSVGIFHHQYRTLDQIHLFQSKDGKTVTLKIYDLSRNRSSKDSLQVDPAQIQTLFKEPASLSALFQKKNPPPSGLFEDLSTELGKIINLLKLQVPTENKQTESFTCPISFDVFKDPVINKCGHTFERTEIEKHLKLNDGCPLCRQPMTIASLIPNLHIRQTLEAAQAQDPIPTFGLFKKAHENLARRNLETAQEYIQEEEYEEALDAYEKAFQFTQNWQDYQPIPLLFQKMKMPHKAQLATLYLAKYQLEAKAYEKAVATLGTLLQENNPTIDIQLRILLIHLYQEHLFKPLPLALTTAPICEGSHPQKAIPLYKYLLHCNPTLLDIYIPLVNLLVDPQEKAHLLLKGACHAIETKDFLLATKFCTLAEELYSKSFVDRLIHLQLLDPKQLIEKLTALAKNYEGEREFKQAIKVYRHLATVDANISHRVKILELAKPQKTLNWAFNWLQQYLQEEAYSSACILARRTLELLSLNPIPDPIPFYNQLVILYTHMNSPRLQPILNDLAKAHSAQGNLALAEKIYQEAFQKFPTFEQATALAQILEQQKDKIPQAVQTYYEAASLAQGDIQALDQTINKLLQIDPLMQYLQTTQKILIFTQKQLCQMSKELQAARQELKELKEKLRQPEAAPIQPVEKNPPVKDISSLTEEEQCAFVQNHRKPEALPTIRMLAGTIWKNSNGDIKKLENFFEWLYRGATDMVESYQTYLVLSCLNECRNEELEAVIWQKYKIADFIDDVLKHKTMRGCLIPLMKVSTRAFAQVMKTIQKNGSEEQFVWFVTNLGQCIQPEYLSDDLNFFLLGKHLNISLDGINFVVAAAFGEIAAHADKQSISRILDSLGAILLLPSNEFAKSVLEQIVVHANKESIPILLAWFKKAITSGNANVRKIAVKTIGKVAARANKEFVPTLFQLIETAFDDNDVETSSAAAIAFGEAVVHAIDKESVTIIFPLFQKILRTQYWDRVEIVKAFGKIALLNVNKQSIDAIDWLKSIAYNGHYCDTRAAAVQSLGEIALHSDKSFISTIMKPLRDALADKTRTVRDTAITAFEKIAAHADKELIPSLFDELKMICDNNNMDAAAIEALGKVTSYGNREFILTVFNWLETIFCDKNSPMSQTAVTVLAEVAEVHGMDKEFTPIILRLLQMALKNQNCYEIATALGKIAPHVDKQSIPTIVEELKTMALNGYYCDTRAAAIRSLKEIAIDVDKSAFPILLRILDIALADKTVTVRGTAETALAEIIPHVVDQESISTISSLFDRVLSTNIGIHSPALRSLGKVAVKDKKFIPKILNWLKTALDNQLMHSVALEVLHDIPVELLMPSFIAYPTFRPLILEYFVNQAIPLYLVEKDAENFIEVNGISFPISKTQKESIAQLCSRLKK